MTNSRLLKEAIVEAGVTMAWLADRMQISRESLYNKINGLTEFKGSEIANITQLLHLSGESRDKIFLLLM